MAGYGLDDDIWKQHNMGGRLDSRITLRLDADYKPSIEVEGDDAREAIAIMKKIFEAF